MDQHQYYMAMAIDEAKKAAASGEIPIGAVVVKDGQVIGRGHNCRESSHDPTGHAEIIALREAGCTIGDWHLDGCDIYVTMEPCPMCAGALINARIDTVIYGANEDKYGACGSQLNLLQFPGFNHNVHIIGPIAQEACQELLQTFFQDLRRGDGSTTPS